MTTFNIDNVGRLRPMCDDDLELVLSWRNAPNVRKNMYSQDEIALSDHLRWWANINESPQDAYFVFEQDVDQLGVVSFTEIDLKNQSALWAFYASPSAPKGTGSRMETLALEYFFSKLGLNKLCCEVLASNTPVLGLHKKFGFVEEGFFVDHRRIGADFVNVHRLAMRAANWAQRRSGFLPATTLEDKK